MELHRTTKDARYLEATRRAIEDTWEQGELSADGRRFAYFKTLGPCSRGWQVKNVNMLMAVPMALLWIATGDDRYRRRAEQLVEAQRAEVDRSVGGRSAPNFGYYAVDTMRAKGKQGGYIAAAQTTDLDKPIICNRMTGSGESCTNHLGIEARGLAFAERLLGRPPESYRRQVLAIMDAYGVRDAEMCANERTKLGRTRSYTACVAYYCALRRLEPRFDDLCITRVTAWGVKSQDATLGLFWGARR